MDQQTATGLVSRCAEEVKATLRISAGFKNGRILRKILETHARKFEVYRILRATELLTLIALGIEWQGSLFV